MWILHKYYQYSTIITKLKRYISFEYLNNTKFAIYKQKNCFKMIPYSKVGTAMVSPSLRKFSNSNPFCTSYKTVILTFNLTLKWTRMLLSIRVGALFVSRVPQNRSDVYVQFNFGGTT